MIRATACRTIPRPQRTISNYTLEAAHVDRAVRAEKTQTAEMMFM
jgi:hypothetical protein